MTIKDLQPSEVFGNFYEITRQPRPSKHEEKIRAFLLDWAVKNGIEAFTDETGNVIMRVNATPGYENLKGVILQGHMDMVPQKNSDVIHDFLTDPIETRVEGDWLKACGTTLGADNGLGVAMAMAVAQSRDIPHGPIELLITYDEETGMTGASALKPGVLKGDILINLDSEAEGELYVGCAGGVDCSAEGTYEPVQAPQSYKKFSLIVKGCQGGHSGMDIILCRANANRIAARLLYRLLKESDALLCCLEGGTLRNAIPRECFGTLLIKDEARAKAVFDREAAEILAEFALSDPDMSLALCEKTEPCKDGGSCCTHCISREDSLRIVSAILACPDGVERMSTSVEGLVETSNNLAMVKVGKGCFSVKTLMRSSVDSAKDALADRFEAVFTLAGARCNFAGGYSGWAPNPKSEIVSIMKKVYKDMFGQEPRVMAIHAGLECGILSGAYPHWDMVSCGPTLMSPHSPDERAFIPSVGKVWEYLKAVLKAIPCKQ